MHQRLPKVAQLAHFTQSGNHELTMAIVVISDRRLPTVAGLRICTSSLYDNVCNGVLGVTIHLTGRSCIHWKDGNEQWGANRTFFDDSNQIIRNRLISKCLALSDFLTWQQRCKKTKDMF